MEDSPVKYSKAKLMQLVTWKKNIKILSKKLENLLDKIPLFYDKKNSENMNIQDSLKV